jgi:hypothetical protein
MRTVVGLDIPDNDAFVDPALVALLQARVPTFLSGDRASSWAMLSARPPHQRFAPMPTRPAKSAAAPITGGMRSVEVVEGPLPVYRRTPRTTDKAVGEK